MIEFDKEIKKERQMANILKTLESPVAKSF